MSSESTVSRRQFGQGVVATAVIVGTTGATAFVPALAGSRPQGFAVRHDDSVRVLVGDGETFSVEVISTETGATLEHDTDLDVAGVLRLRSEHVEYYRIRPPGT